MKTKTSPDAPTLVQATVDQLREALLRGEFAAGSPLRESDACAYCKVSRTAVRMAMWALHLEGLLDYQAQKGYRVRTFELADTQDAYALRGVIEGLACRFLVERKLVEGILPELRQLVRTGRTILAAANDDGIDMVAWREMNVRFHAALLRPMGQVFQETSNFVRRTPYADPTVSADWRARPDLAYMELAQSDHEHVVAALAAGQATRAETILSEHLYRAGEVLGATLA